MVKPRILVIRGGAIGDFILTLPAIRLLRENFPSAHLEILGYKHIVALGEERFYADATRSIEYGAMAGFFIPNSELAPELVQYFGSFQQIVSYLYDPDGYFEANLRRANVKNVLSAFAQIDDSEHASRQLARPLQQLALYLEEHAAEVFPSDHDRAAAAQFFGPHDRPIVAIHPGSGSAKKNWALERWMELGKRLASERPGSTLLLIGGEADQMQIERLAAAWSGLPVRIAQHLPLPELAAVLQRCTVFLGHDSGISHLAAAVGTPCLLLFGPTDPEIWAPANRGVSIIHAPDSALSALTAETVLSRVLAMV